MAVNAIHPGTRLPTKIVLASGAEPLGSLALGIETRVREVTSELHNLEVLARRRAADGGRRVVSRQNSE